MSVYTPLTLAQVQDFAAAYGLSVQAISPIQGGIENTNYFVHAAPQTDYVLTVFEELDFVAAAELAPVLQYLAQQGVPVAVPLMHRGQSIHTLAGKPAQLAPRMLGQHPLQPSVNQTQALAEAQARMHLALQQRSIQRGRNSNQQHWHALAASLMPSLNPEDQALLTQVQTQLQLLQQQYPNRPQGWIHADLFRDNCLFDGEQLSAILDFSELSFDDLLFDVAISLNDFAYQAELDQVCPLRTQAFLAGYNHIRPLTSDELACLDIYLAIAACRFWISRLYTVQRNAREGRVSDDILQKDPNSMRKLLQKRLAQVVI